jgi:hypothetical protein
VHAGGPHINPLAVRVKLQVGGQLLASGQSQRQIGAGKLQEQVGAVHGNADAKQRRRLINVVVAGSRSDVIKLFVVIFTRKDSLAIHPELGHFPPFA